MVDEIKEVERKLDRCEDAEERQHLRKREDHLRKEKEQLSEERLLLLRVRVREENKEQLPPVANSSSKISLEGNATLKCDTISVNVHHATLRL